ncbi:CTP pyrophosphohydrolase [bioreactor metagenome]|uniref:8-oxo-dGTP diphosphatase n=1 Tax=bioreactor metagenome TaxID=1076179 RepID=A0A644Y3N7_9ZZZZ
MSDTLFSPPHPTEIHVAAGVIFADGRVLAAERPAGKSGAGLWEFPGGKLEPGETTAAALARELREELALEVVIFDEMFRLAAPVSGGRQLILHFLRAFPMPGSRPHGREQQQFRWLAPTELDAVEWLPNDRKLIDFLR